MHSLPYVEVHVVTADPIVCSKLCISTLWLPKVNSAIGLKFLTAIRQSAFLVDFSKILAL